MPAAIALLVGLYAYFGYLWHDSRLFWLSGRKMKRYGIEE